ncbi:FMN-binding negative transcriptional regulator [Ferrimicrobium acidiphilum]|jgi:transcriptional regulator|uniref:Protease synthase and sporulation protein PAI 2 n=1 Tax=Ferrimicrobium acidiphilum DSM 19497 TaxID=1121877 RepID=A0A0D8FRE6_9ACTN|nr:FMN-binding negative transcriptional regulator [Ferrimicrobium acidiphilum]KJE75544.1 protease synthase and sporulation protein PAI 2 [Ferrimicrobium acidiphilum DSM 19497]
MSPAKLFYTDDIPTLIAIAKENPFGDLVTVGANGPLTTAIPLLITVDGDDVMVQGHLTRTNPQWRQSRLDLEALAVFRAEHSYVSPRWYRTSADNQHHVPTWNYSRVEAVGELEFFDDANDLLTLVTTLTAKFEPPAPTGWSPDQSPDDYISAQLKAIVGFNLRVRELRGIRKLSQNKPLEDRKAVIASLDQIGETTLASTMRSLLDTTND